MIIGYFLIDYYIKKNPGIGWSHEATPKLPAVFELLKFEKIIVTTFLSSWRKIHLSAVVFL